MVSVPRALLSLEFSRVPGEISTPVCRPDDIGKYSNSLRGYTVAKAFGDILGYLRTLDSPSVQGRPEGWIASDQYLTMILEHRADFENVLSFAEPGLDFLSEFNDKERAFVKCREAGVNVPERATLGAVMDNRVESGSRSS